MKYNFLNNQSINLLQKFIIKSESNINIYLVNFVNISMHGLPFIPKLSVNAKKIVGLFKLERIGVNLLKSIFRFWLFSLLLMFISFSLKFEV